MDLVFPPNCPSFNTSTKTSELRSHLETLSKALQETDAIGEIDKHITEFGSSTDNLKNSNSSKIDFENLGIFLTDDDFLNHSNEDVKIWLACCLADILRLISPKNPFVDFKKLKKFLIFLTSALRGLDKPNNHLFRRYFYLLENIAAVNTFNLVLELPNEESNVVLKLLLKTAMDIVNSKEWAKGREVSEELLCNEDASPKEEDDRKEKMFHLLFLMISKIIGDLDNISKPVLDTLFYYLINPQKSNYRESYSLTKNIVQAVHTSLEVPIESLLTHALLVGGLPEDFELVGSSLKKLYDVIIELHEALPSLVTPIIPQIGNFLREEDEDTRISAMKAIAAIAQNANSRICDDYPLVWNTYIERSRDTSAKIKIAFCKQALLILVGSVQLRGTLSQALCRLLRDPDDSVRSEAINTIYEAARQKLDSINEQLIQSCCDRLNDQKPGIRQDTMYKLLSLYGKVVLSNEYTSSDKQVVTVIADHALRMYRINTMKEESTRLERYLQNLLIPYKLEPRKRTKHMIELHSKLLPVAAENLRFIIMRNCSYRRLMKEILVIMSKEDQTLEWRLKEIDSRAERISKEQSHPSAFSTMIKKLINFLGDERRAFDILSYVVGTETECNTVASKITQFLQLAAGSKAFLKDDLTYLRHFIERFAPLILDGESAEILVYSAIKAERDCCIKLDKSDIYLGRLLGLMNTWSGHLPHVFLGEKVQEYLRQLACADTPIAVYQALLAMKDSYSIPKVSATATQTYRSDTSSLLIKLALSEDSSLSRCSKMAIYTLAKLCPKDEYQPIFKKIWEQAVDRLDITLSSCVNAERVLMAIFKVAREDNEEQYGKVVAELVIQPLILSAETCITDLHDIDIYKENFSLMKIPKYTAVKTFGIKMLCRQLLGKPEQDRLAQKTLKLLNAFLEYQGNIFKDDPDANISPIEQAMLRATSGTQMLHMAAYVKYQNMITLEQYIWLGNLLLDEVHAVRVQFSRILSKLFQKNVLIVEYMAFYALLPILKEQQTSDAVDRFLIDQSQQLKQIIIHRVQNIKLRSNQIKQQNLPFWQPEYVLAYTCFLLAANPICQNHKDIANMELLRECLWFIIDLFRQIKGYVDFELMYRVLQEVRQCSSVHASLAMKNNLISISDGEEVNKKMWALADLGMCMMVYRAKLLIKNAHEEEPILSVKFFKKLPHRNDEIYAPQEMIDDEQKRNGKMPVDRKRKANGSVAASSSSKQGGGETSKEYRKGRLTRKPASKRENFSSDESEDREMEVIPKPKKRKAPINRNENLGTEEITTKSPSRKTMKTGEDTSPTIEKESKKRGQPIVLPSTRQARTTFERLPFSPIPKDTPSSKHEVGIRKGFVSSTPLTKQDKQRLSRLKTIKEAPEKEDSSKAQVQVQPRSTRKIHDVISSEKSPRVTRSSTRQTRSRKQC